MDNLLGSNVSSTYMTPAFYKVPIGELAANGSGTATLLTDGDSIFKLFYFQGTTEEDDPAEISPNNFEARVRLNTGRLITNDFIPQRILCPTQQFALLEPCQIEFPGNTQITFDFNNLTAATQNIQLVLRGVKIYVT